MAFTKEDLKAFQNEPIDRKFQRTLAKVSEWYSRWHNQVYVAFSGGKDSTVLADIVARWCKAVDCPLYLVFVNTGLEYPEIQRFVPEYAEYLRQKHGIEVVLEILRPKMRFDEVIKKYGYPMISKEAAERVESAKKCIASNGLKYIEHYYQINATFPNVRMDQLMNDERYKRYGKRYSFTKWKPLVDVDFNVSSQCCGIMKKKPIKQYAKETGRKPMTAQMASESRLRMQKWLQHGCNGFDMKEPISNPMSFWTEQDVLLYIKQENLPMCSVYGEIVYAEEPDQMRFGNEEGLKLTTTGCNRTGCVFCGFGCHLEKEPTRFQRLKQTHPRQYEYCLNGGEYDENGVWKPNKEGLGMRHVFDELNKIYGKDFIKYE